LKSFLRNPKFGKCCLSGKIWLPTLDQPPPELHTLLTSQDPRAKGFHTNIRKYNDALAMTSVGHDLLLIDGGPYVFKVHGSLSHRAGSLFPAPNQPPVYAQLYIYDPDDALTYRMDNPHNVSLDRTIMNDLQDMLHRHNHGVILYKSAMEMTRNTVTLWVFFKCTLLPKGIYFKKHNYLKTMHFKIITFLKIKLHLNYDLCKKYNFKTYTQCRMSRD